MTFNPTHRLTRPIGVTYVVGEQFQITECGTEGRVHGAFSDDRQVWMMDSEYELLPQEDPVTFKPTHLVTTDLHHTLTSGEEVEYLGDNYFRSVHGSSYFLGPDEVELISQDSPVTELVPGKRYRWAVEGTANEHGLELPSGGLLIGRTLADGELELLPEPLPTALSSVVRSSNAFSYTLGVRGWRCSATDELISTEMLNRYPFTVLFDAGAES